MRLLATVTTVLTIQALLIEFTAVANVFITKSLIDKFIKL